MRTRFVIHKNLLSTVFRVIPRKEIAAVDPSTWNPEDIPVENPRRYEIDGSFFILPKSEYIPCNKDGVVRDNHAENPQSLL